MWIRNRTAFAIVPIAATILLVLGEPNFSSRVRSLGAEAAERVNAGFQTITSEQLSQRMTSKDFVLVNVHIPYEGEIRGTDAFIPYDRIAQNLDKLPRDKTARIVLYCRSGRMSEIAAAQLSELGYTQVSHLSGGMIAWKNAGYDLQER